ncbi:NnrU family protein [Photobacterium rosenbergii]|uniref:NnrU family protein n=1 Tax=Photobacterium rosenbergii TaxID=294936 RepID=A0A2T3NJX7_9GAMM|nr:NnrU family protein [Photobacterium rosenbergii]PSW15773.1 NnrU family protein [Photobacterium rosenbergii]
MVNLLLGLFLFLGIHSVSIFSESLRDRLAAKSLLGWKAFYAFTSVAGIVLIGIGYAQLRLEPVFVYVTPYWLRHVTYLMMLPAMILLVAPYFPGRISTTTKHPQLLAVKLWAISHLLVNGMLADVILFVSFLMWSVFDFISMNRRESREVPGLKPSVVNDIIVVVLGVVLTVAMIFSLHGTLIGMPLAG